MKSNFKKKQMRKRQPVFVNGQNTAYIFGSKRSITCVQLFKIAHAAFDKAIKFFSSDQFKNAANALSDAVLKQQTKDIIKHNLLEEMKNSCKDNLTGKTIINETKL